MFFLIGKVYGQEKISDDIMTNTMNDWYYGLYPELVLFPEDSLSQKTVDIDPIWYIGTGRKLKTVAFMTGLGADIEQCKVSIYNLKFGEYRIETHVPINYCGVDEDPGRVKVPWSSGRMALLENEAILRPIFTQNDIKYPVLQTADLTDEFKVGDVKWTLFSDKKCIGIVSPSKKQCLYNIEKYRDNKKPFPLGGFSPAYPIVCILYRQEQYLFERDKIECTLLNNE